MLGKISVTCDNGKNVNGPRCAVEAKQAGPGEGEATLSHLHLLVLLRQTRYLCQTLYPILFPGLNCSPPTAVIRSGSEDLSLSSQSPPEFHSQVSLSSHWR